MTKTPKNPADPASAPRDRKVTQDRGFKAAFEAFGADTVAFFLPDEVEKHGPPVSVTLIQQEVLPQSLDEHSMFLDAALLATWADGHRSVILAIEHHSEARRIDPPRLAQYVANLQVRHRDCEVHPCVLVTDRSGATVPASHSWTAGGKVVMILHWQVVHIGEADLERLRNEVERKRNRIAALLVVLAFRDAIDGAIAAVKAMRASGYTPAQARRFMPLVSLIARIDSHEQPRFRQRLLDEAPDMRTFLDDMIDEKLAKSTAKAKADGELVAILRMVSKGHVTTAVARAEIADLVANGTVTQAQADAALAQLPKRTVRRATAVPAKKKRRR